MLLTSGHVGLTIFTPSTTTTPCPQGAPLTNATQSSSGQKLVVRDGPLSTKLYCAIGMVAVAWAHFEDIIALTLSRLLGADHVEFLPVSANMPIKARLDSLKALAPVRLALPAAEAVIALVDQANLLSRERNKILHASWLQGGADEIGVRFTYRAHGRISTDIPTMSAQEIAATADRINLLASQFTGTLQQIGLYDPRSPMTVPERKENSEVKPHRATGP